ncbi:MAG: hypothetical protein M1820_005538 [Bogoriella megaspora]|nr:MAG: hypothetical protein M1820_005538 [Bogoriella megaspora]
MAKRKRHATSQQPNKKQETVPKITEAPSIQEIYQNFRLIQVDTNNKEELLKYGDAQGCKKLPRVRVTPTRLLKLIQEQFANKYDLATLNGELQKLEPGCPRYSSPWDAMAALAEHDGEGLHLFMRVNKNFRPTPFELHLLPSRWEIHNLLPQYFEDAVQACIEADFDPPSTLDTALSYLEYDAIMPQLKALPIQRTYSPEHALILLREFDDRLRKDILALGPPSREALQAQGRVACWEWVEKETRPLRELALKRGYDVDEETPAHVILRMMEGWAVGDGEETLREACELVGLRQAGVPLGVLRGRWVEHENRVWRMRYPELLDERVGLRVQTVGKGREGVERKGEEARSPRSMSVGDSGSGGGGRSGGTVIPGLGELADGSGGGSGGNRADRSQLPQDIPSLEVAPPHALPSVGKPFEAHVEAWRSHSRQNTPLSEREASSSQADDDQAPSSPPKADLPEHQQNAPSSEPLSAEPPVRVSESQTAEEREAQYGPEAGRTTSPHLTGIRLDYGDWSSDDDVEDEERGRGRERSEGGNGIEGGAEGEDGHEEGYGGDDSELNSLFNE